jgi:hypothetical protein
LFVKIIFEFFIGTEFRRPATADSAKTSNMDSDDLDGEESN